MKIFGATVMLFYRIILSISWMEYVCNEENLHKMETRITLILRIRERQLKFEGM